MAPLTGSLRRFKQKVIEQKLKTKLVQLDITMARTGKILKVKNSKAIERHKKALKTIIAEIDECNRTVEAEQDVDEIEQWVAMVDDKLAKADTDVDQLCEFKEDIKENSTRERTTV